MKTIRVEKLLIKAENRIKGLVRFLFRHKLKLFLALLGVVTITGGAIFATGGSFTVNKPATLSLTDGLVGYWTFDDPDIAGVDVYDQSGEGNDGTMTNGPTKTIGKIGQALEFDGDDDYVDVGTGVMDFSADSSSFSVSLWVKTTFDGSDNYFMGTDLNTGWYIRTSSVDNDALLIKIDDGVDDEYTAGTTPLNDGKWHNLVLTLDSEINDFLGYVDGIKEITLTTGSVNDLDDDLTLGNVFKMWFNGTIDEVRIYDRALSQEEITRLYKMGGSKVEASQTSKLTDGLVGSWSFDDPDIYGTTVVDRSGQGNNGTITNGPTKTIGKIGQALKFDGDDDYVEIANDNSINPASIITISMWIYPKDYGQFDVLIGKVTGDGTGWRLWTRDASNYRFYWETAIGSYIFSTSQIQLNQWQHIVVTKDTTTAKIYINGQLENSDLTTDLYDSDQNLLLGSMNVAGRYFNGSIDDVRVYNRALSQEEITSLYKMGESKVNKSQTSKLTDGLVGMWSFSDADIYGTTAIDRSGQGNNGSIAGATKTMGKIGQAMEFNGDDYINVGDDASLYMDDNFTVSWWMKSALSQKTWGGVFVKGEATSGNTWNYGCNYYSTSDTDFRCVVCSTTETVVTASSGFTIPIGVWTHVVLRVDATDVSVYKNGVFGNSVGRPSGTMAGSGKKLLLGAAVTSSATYNYNGAIDEFRVYNRALSQEEITRLYNMGK